MARRVRLGTAALVVAALVVAAGTATEAATASASPTTSTTDTSSAQLKLSRPPEDCVTTKPPSNFQLFPEQFRIISAENPETAAGSGLSTEVRERGGDDQATTPTADE